MLDHRLLYFHTFSIYEKICILFVHYFQKASDKFWSETRCPKLSPNFATPLSVMSAKLKTMHKIDLLSIDYSRKTRERLWSKLNDLQFWLKLKKQMSVIFLAVWMEGSWRSSRKKCWIDFKDKTSLFKLASVVSVTFPQL